MIERRTNTVPIKNFIILLLASIAIKTDKNMTPIKASTANERNSGLIHQNITSPSYRAVLTLLLFSSAAYSSLPPAVNLCIIRESNTLSLNCLIFEAVLILSQGYNLVNLPAVLTDHSMRRN